jgi:hypothetical protein
LGIVQQFLAKALIRSLPLLDLFPRAVQLRKICHHSIPKHMGVTADELIGNSRSHSFQIKVVLLGKDLRLQHHLQQQIPQLFGNCCRIPGSNGSYRLIRFFKNVGGKRLWSLGPIPRTPVGSAQPSNNSRQTTHV